jgi:Fimbrial assembly protein (PilN)
VSQQINLFNPQFLEQKRYFSAETMVQALGLLVLGILGFYGFVYWQDRDAVRQAAESARAYDQQKALLAKAAAELNPEKFESQLDQDLKTTEAAIALRRLLLSEIQSGTGAPSAYSEYLRAFARQTVQGLWLTGIQITEGGGQLNLSGRALQADLVPVLIARLKQEAVLRGRPLDALAITRSVAGESKRAIVEFTVTSPAPTADARP